MVIHSTACSNIRCGVGWKRLSMRSRLQESFDEERNQLLYREFGRRRFHGHTDMFTADRHVGCNGNLVLGIGSVQNRRIPSGTYVNNELRPPHLTLAPRGLS